MQVFKRWRRVTVALAAVLMLAAVPAVLAAQTASTVEVGGNEELGEFLVGGNGMTLYIFTPDEPGVSNCNGGCAAAWPPLMAPDGGTPSAGPGVDGELTLITRDDGSQQVALDGAALYFYRDDSVAGEANGQDVNDVWFVVDSGGAIVQTPATEPASGPTEPAAGPAEPVAAPAAGSAGSAGLIGTGDTSPLVVVLLLASTIALVFLGRTAVRLR